MNKNINVKARLKWMTEFIIILFLIIIFFICFEINLKLNDMGQELENLTNEVSETKGVMASAKLAIEGFSQALKDAIAKNDPAALTQLAADLDAETNSLAGAIAANPLPSDNG